MSAAAALEASTDDPAFAERCPVSVEPVDVNDPEGEALVVGVPAFGHRSVDLGVCGMLFGEKAIGARSRGRTTSHLLPRRSPTSSSRDGSRSTRW